MSKTIHVNGTRGELTPLMHARYDTDFYQSAYAKARNTVITRYGPHTRVPGTIVQGLTKYPNRQSRQLPFEFSEEQIYALEFGHLYVRFWTPEGRIISGGVPYEIVSIYDEEDLPFLHVRQSGDVVYVFCNGYRPMILKRLAETNWAFEQYLPQDGPYIDLNTTSTLLTLNDTQNVVPKMTDNNVPAPYVVNSDGGGTDHYGLFSRDKDRKIQVSGGSSGTITVDLGAANAKVLDNYFLISGADNHKTDAMFGQWDLQGSNNGSDWVTLDSRDNERGWAGAETRFYETSNKQAFRYYRLKFSGGGGGGVDNATYAGGWYMHQAPEDQTPANLNASNTIGINNDEGFKSSDIGRPVRLQGPDGLWRWAEITGYSSPTQVQVRVHGQAFLGTDPIQNWRLGAWSDTTGWPRTGRLFEDRLALAGWPQDPIGMALSVNGDYDNFRTSSPLVDDDAITLRMTGGRFDIINWLAEASTLLAGTAGGLRSIGGRDSSAVLKNDNIRQRLETSTAASSAQPLQVENTILFMDKLRRRLYEAGYDYQSDGFVAREVSVLNDHLFKRGVDQLDFVDAPYKTVIGRRSDGQLVFFAYDREQKIAGGTLCDLGFVEDVMVLPGREYPELWLTIRRERLGNTVRYIEKLAPFWDGEIDPDALPIYSACSYTYDGAATATLTGLTALAGETVGIWADGLDIGDAEVSEAGSVTLPYGKTGERIVVGERINWRIETLRTPPAPQTGSVVGDKMRVVSVAVDVYETARIYGGSTVAVERIRDEDEVELDPDLPEPLLTKMLKVPVDDSWQNGGVVVIRGNSMYPATIRAIAIDVEVEP